MLDSDKLALKNSTAVIRCKLIVKATDTLPEIILTDDDSIKDWTYTDDRYVPQQGFIGQFVSRTLEGNLQNISDDFNIENREIELVLGVTDLGSKIIYVTTEDGIILMTENGDYFRLSELGEATTNWYSFGNFIITNPEDNEVADNTKFEAMDYTKLFNKEFNENYTDEKFPESFNTLIENGGSVTALWLAQYVCAQVDVEFGQDYFTNSDFVINQNPFQELETCRDVMKYIAQLAFSWVRIDWDNKCYIDFGETPTTFSTDEYNTIDNNQYYTLETKKETYGPINEVIIGMEGIDGESLVAAEDLASINENGRHTLYIYDNPLTNTFELRTLLKENGSANKLLGLTYTQLKTETVGHPWFKGYEIINVVDMENIGHTTFPFNKTLTYNGHIETTLDSMGETEVEETLAYESDVIKSTKQASIKVNKQEGTLTSLAKEVNTQTGVINSVEEKITAYDYTISVVGEYINDDTGELEVNKVTTINNYTFNENGLNISSGDTKYNATIDEQGTYYKNGDEALVRTTITGSVLKNLSEQGQHRFSYNEYNDANDPNDDYDFVEERIEVDGEYAYALFYNGEE